jgi:hypothetical protein
MEVFGFDFVGTPKINHPGPLWRGAGQSAPVHPASSISRHYEGERGKVSVDLALAGY